MTPEVQNLLEEKYLASNLRKIGVGGFAEVYSATIGPIPCAIKVSLREVSPSDRERFEQEFTLMDDPAIRDCDAILQAFIRHDDLDCPYLISIWELGEKSLAKRLEECVGQRLKGIPLRELEGYMRDVARAIDCIRELGFVHRDLKPDNIILKQRRARVADFGLAVFTGASEISASRAGTHGYLPPEAYGEDELPRGVLHHSLDIYSLAATTIHLATGNPPFGKNLPKIFENQRSGSPATDGLTAGQKLAAEKALHPDPSQRYRSAIDFVEDFFVPTPYIGEYDMSPYPEEITHPSGLQLKLIMPGAFMMGATDEAISLERAKIRARVMLQIEENDWSLKREMDQGRTLDEIIDEKLSTTFSSSLPRHRVCISRPFYFAMKFVTYSDWERVVGRAHPDRCSETEPKRDPKLSQAGYVPYPPDGESISDLPMESFRTHEFFQRVNAPPFVWKYGPLSLPTEAQWEYCLLAGGAESVDKHSDAFTNNTPFTNAWGLKYEGFDWEACSDGYSPRAYSWRSGTTIDPCCDGIAEEEGPCGGLTMVRNAYYPFRRFHEYTSYDHSFYGAPTLFRVVCPIQGLKRKL